MNSNKISLPSKKDISMTTTRRKFMESVARGLTALGLAGWPSASTAKNLKSQMLVHQVYFWLKDKQDKTAYEKLHQGLLKLLTISRIESGHIGIPAATEARDVVDHSYTFAYMARFESKDDHDSYQTDPTHLEFVEECADLWSHVKVYDSNLI